MALCGVLFGTTLGLSIGRSGSGLCPTCDRPNQIGQIETSTRSKRVGQGRKSGKQQESGVDLERIRHKNGEKQPKSLMFHQIRPNLGHFWQDLG